MTEPGKAAADPAGGWRAPLVLGGVAFVFFLALGLRDPVVHLTDFFGHSVTARRIGVEPAAKLTSPWFPIGYPLLLKAVWALTGDALVAARLIGAFFAAVALAMMMKITRDVTGDGRVSWAVALACALAPPFAQWAPAEGTDLPSLAMMLVSLACLTAARPSVFWAGAAAGLAYDFRYAVQVPLLAQGLWLLAVGVQDGRPRWKQTTLYAAAALVAASPQLGLTWWVHGTPLRSFMAKNVWFGIYGDNNWQERWADVPDEIGLAEVFLLSPRRFLEHWGACIFAFAVGSLAFPKTLLGQGANWLLPLGLIHVGFRCGRLLRKLALREAPAAGERESGLVYWTAATYFLALTMAFLGPRYFLPLLMPLMLGVWWFVRDAVPESLEAAGRRWPVRTIVLAGLVAGKVALDLPGAVAFPESSRWVLAVDERLRQAGMKRGAEVLAANGDYYDVRTLERYTRWESALPAKVANLDELVALMRKHGCRFLLYDDFYGRQKTLPHLSWLQDTSKGRHGPLVLLMEVPAEVPAVIYELK